MSSYYEKFLATGEVKCIDKEIPFEIPNGWEWCRLKYIGITETGTTPTKSHPEYFGDVIPFYGPGNIQDNKIISVTQGISKQGLPYSRIVPSNTILQVCIGGSIGKAAITQTKCSFNQQINSVTIYNGISTLYIFYVLISDFFKQQIMDKSTGTATPIINRSNWENLLIPMPTNTEQQLIVDKLTELLPIIGKYNKSQDELDLLNISIKERLQKSTLQEAIQGKLVPQIQAEGTAEELLAKIRKEKELLVKEGKLKKSALTDSVIFKGDDNKYWEKVGKEVRCIDDEIPFEIPSNWVYTRMGNIGDWGSGSTPAKGNSDYYGGNILWLRTGELNNGVVNDTEIKITDKALKECSFKLNKPGDVLIAMYGATIGKVAIAGKEMTTNQACCGCTTFIYNKYLFYFLIASKNDFVRKGEGGAQPNISREKLVLHLIPLPPLKEQYRIVSKIEELASIMSR